MKEAEKKAFELYPESSNPFEEGKHETQRQAFLNGVELSIQFQESEYFDLYEQGRMEYGKAFENYFKTLNK